MSIIPPSVLCNLDDKSLECGFTVHDIVRIANCMSIMPPAAMSGLRLSVLRSSNASLTVFDETTTVFSTTNCTYHCLFSDQIGHVELHISVVVVFGETYARIVSPTTTKRHLSVECDSCLDRGQCF
jgi:hypothetical protein